MDSAGYLAAIQRDGAALAAIADGHLDRQVPPCPEWKVADLVHHLGRVHRWVAATVAAGERVDFPPPDAPGDERLIEWFHEGHAAVVQALSAAPDTAAWTFSALGDNTVGWWRRRQALETAVHRFDAEAAAGVEPQPVDADLAVDGIEELLFEFFPRWKDRDEVKAMSGTLHLHCTDVDGEWLIDLEATPPTVERQHGKGDAALRGSAGSLYLWLWNRLTTDSDDLEVFGSPDIVEAWQTLKI